jgi:hypothetical protein
VRDLLVAPSSRAAAAPACALDATIASIVQQVMKADPVRNALAANARFLGDLCEFAFQAIGSWQRVAGLVGDVLGRLAAAASISAWCCCPSSRRFA